MNFFYEVSSIGGPRFTLLKDGKDDLIVNKVKHYIYIVLKGESNSTFRAISGKSLLKGQVQRVYQPLFYLV